MSSKIDQRLEQAEQSQAAQALQTLAARLEPDEAFRQNLESHLRRLSEQPRPSVGSLNKNAPLVGSTLPGLTPRQKSRRRLALVGLSLVVFLAVTLMALVYLYAATTPAYTPGTRLSGPQQVASQTLDDKCVKQNINPVECLLLPAEDEPLPTRYDWLPLSLQPNLSQSANGYTVTIRRAYADANRIIIGYDIKGKNVELRKDDLLLTLKNENQASLFYSSGRGLSFDDWAGELLYFNAETVKGSVSKLELHLDVPNVWVRNYDPNQLLTPGTTITNPDHPVPVNLSFDLSIPFVAGQEIKLGQTQGNATLQRAVLTPSESRFYLTGIGEITPDASLTLDNGQGQTAPRLTSALRYPDGLARLGFEDVPPGPHYWTLRVTPGRVDGWNPITRLNQLFAGGPWTFNFDTK